MKRFLPIILRYVALAASQWLYVVCYACAKIPGSILYGYARMKHGMLLDYISSIDKPFSSNWYCLNSDLGRASTFV